MSKEPPGVKITVGDIKDSTGVAIGPGARASVQRSPGADADQVVAMLNALVGLIDTNAGALGDAGPAREAAVLACEEARRPTPRWARIRNLLQLISPAVTDVAALTKAIDNIRELLPH